MRLLNPVLAQIPNPLNPVGDALGGAASKAAEKTFEFFVQALATALANAARKVGQELLGFLDKSSTVSLDQGWFAGPRAREVVSSVVLFAAVLMVLFLLAAIIQGLVAGDPVMMLRSAAVEVPLSVFAMVALTAVTGVLLAITDAASAMVLATAPESLARYFEGFGTAANVLSSGLLGAVMLGAFILAGLLVWVELVVRSALIYLLLAFAPLVLAARVWPALRGAWHQLCRIGLALIVSKFAIALALALGAASLGGGGPQGGDLGTQAGLGLGGLLAGTTLMVLAAFSPFVVLKLLPVFEAAVVAHGISRSPARAAQTAMQTAYYGQGLARMGQGRGGAASAGSPSAAGSNDTGSASGPAQSPGGGPVPALVAREETAPRVSPAG